MPRFLAHPLDLERQTVLRGEKYGDDTIDSYKLDLSDAIGDLFDRLLSFLLRHCCVVSQSVCLSLSDECIWFWWSLSLSDEVTEGSPEAFRPTVLSGPVCETWIWDNWLMKNRYSAVFGATAMFVAGHTTLMASQLRKIINRIEYKFVFLESFFPKISIEPGLCMQSSPYNVILLRSPGRPWRLSYVFLA